MMLLSISIAAYAGKPALKYKKLNERALKEYSVPVRPGYEGRNPFWNAYSVKFIYSPAFDFEKVDGALSYRFTLRQKDGKGVWSFNASSPKSSLAKIWREVPPGPVTLTVEGLDRDGRVIGKAGERDFFRDYPFEGPFSGPTIDYKESAIKVMRYTHEAPWVQYWLTHDEPDMSFKHYTYACKTISGLINVECLVAENIPSLREEAIKIAKKAASFLIANGQGPDKALAYFPPTYYKGLIASAKKENQGRTMALEALAAATSYLNLYDVTEEDMYLKQALHIADTYRKIQNEDGSFPVKVDYETGEPYTGSHAMLHPVVRFYRRLENKYGVKDYHDVLARAEKWMNTFAEEKFDLESQFEDVNIGGIKPYQNLTNCTAAPYATYLLTGENPSKEDISLALDLIRFSEDQFVHWDVWPDSCGVRPEVVPNVHEQYKYEMGTISSVGNVANAMLDYYLITGDELFYAKAKALIDGITVLQDLRTGRIPTTYKTRSIYKSDRMYDWINCTYSAIGSLLRMDAMTRNNR